ncbi:TonB-dependent receptor [hydrothermal vent metagenome]|uniref:TonB-dependent receptor n=1 Tax=hydrothermal vent metagenome TaxID=652676 RepID=A0A3B0SWG6_9ZZZZ
MKKSLLLTATAIGGLTAVAPAYAQDAQGEEEFDDNVIVVTASKRETTLQETPIAVSVTSAAQIEEAQVRDLLDLQTLVPSLRINQLQTSANTNFIIRGFGNGANNAGIEPSVGVFIDGVYRSRSAAQIGDLPNLQRVEVLRGPQSTLFGKNASAGIISIVTKKPQFEFGGSAELSYGNFNAIIAKADITGPIGDTVAFSLSGNFNKRDGYVQDLALNQDANERNRWGVRGQLLFEPSNDLSFRFIADYDKIDEDCCSVVNLVDGPTGNAVRALGGQIDSNNPFSRISFLNFASTNDIENYGVSLQTDYSTGPFDITAIGAYRAVRSDTNADSDFTSADLIGSNRNATAIDTYTAELRVASDFDGFFNFLIGAYYFKENIDVAASLTYGADFKAYADLLSGGGYSGSEATLRFLIPTIPAGTFGGQGQGRFENYDYSNNSFSIFGQLDFEITDDLTFSAGGNYTRDRKRVAQNNSSTDVFSSIDLVQAGALAGIPGSIPLPTGTIFPRTVPCPNPNTLPAGFCNPFLPLAPFQFLPGYLNFPNAVEDGRTRDNDFSYTLRLAYRISDNFNAYATYATGFKASSFNLSTDSRPFPTDFIPGSPFQVPPPAASPIRTAIPNLPANLTSGTRFAGPEDAEVYEIGLKAQFDGFAFNLALFEQTLKGFQSNVFTGTGFVLGNAEQQSVRGFEIDSSISPIYNLTFTAALTYLDANFDSFTGGSSLTPTFSVVPTDLTGRRPASVPKYSISVGGTYTHEFGNDNELIFHADYLMESNTQIAQGAPTFRRAVEALNASITFAMGNGLAVTLWGRNLTDDVYTTTVFPSVAQAGSLSGYRNQPRTYGGAVKFKF